MEKTENKEQDKFLPFMDRILVKQHESEKKTKSGIIIPDTAKEKPAKGVVVRTGTGLSDRTFYIKEGMVVSFSKYAGSDVELGGETFKVLRETDVIGIYED